MPAFNIVRFRLKPNRETEFLNAHNGMTASNFKGFKSGHLIKTGDRGYCLIAEWNEYEDILAARLQMIEQLNSFRDCLEDLGNGLGVTDAVSGTSLLEMK